VSDNGTECSEDPESQSETATTDEASFAPDTSNDSDLHTQDGLGLGVDGRGAGDLIGGQPPSADESELRAEEATPVSEEPVRAETTNWLERWGPYKRWQWYRTHGDWGDREFLRERDSEANELTRLPADERLAVPAVWITELYTPSTVPGLLQGIDKLGWTHGRGMDQNLAKWMSDVRDGRMAGWTNLGLVSPTSEPHFMRERTADLPAGVKAAMPKLMSLTPGLTAMVMCFIFDDECATSVEVPLRADYQTYTERDPLFRRSHLIRHLLLGSDIRLGERIHDPDLQR